MNTVKIGGQDYPVPNTLSGCLEFICDLITPQPIYEDDEIVGHMEPILNLTAGEVIAILDGIGTQNGN
jgi:hypothetical protein